MTQTPEKKKILWADDEIDLLKPHAIFLNERGYEVTPVTNGDDAIGRIQKEGFDIVLLDEMRAGRDGLSTLAVIKDINPHIPVIMITKNEEERVMEEAIGQRIDDLGASSDPGVVERDAWSWRMGSWLVVERCSACDARSAICDAVEM